MQTRYFLDFPRKKHLAFSNNALKIQTMLQYTILTSDAEVDAIAGEWKQLYTIYGTSPFSSYEWFNIWRHTTGITHDRILHIVTGRVDGKLVALLPLAVIKRKGFRIAHNTGLEAFFQCDLLCKDPNYAEELWRASRNSGLYDFAHLRDVCPDSMYENSLSAFATTHERNRAPYLQLTWKTSQEWEASLPHRLTKDLRRRQRRLEEKGKVTYEIYRELPLPEGMVDAMVEEKAAWCRQQGIKGMFNHPDVISFFHQLIEHNARSGTLLFARMKCGEATITHHFMITWKKKIFSYVVSADYEWFQYSPGHLANMRAIGWAIENGYEEFDHMQGDFLYKYQFSNEVRESKEYTFSTSIYGRLGAKIFIARRDLRNYLATRKQKKAA